MSERENRLKKTVIENSSSEGHPSIYMKKNTLCERESIDGDGFQRTVYLSKNDHYYFLEIRKKDLDDQAVPIIIKEIKLNENDKELNIAEYLLNEFKPNKKGKEVLYGEGKIMRIIEEDDHYRLEIGKRYPVCPENFSTLRSIRLSDKDIRLAKKLFKKIKKGEKSKK